MTVRSSAAALVAAAAVASLAACADSASVTAPTASSGLSATKDLEFNNPRHEFHTREYFARQDAEDGGSRYARPSSGSGTGISYHGGTVLQTGTKVVAIYWGSSTYPVGYQNLPSGASTTGGSGDGSLIGTFLRSFGSVTDVAGKNHFNINHTYWGPGGSATTNLIAPTVSYTGYWNTVSSSGAPVPTASPTDAEMVALIRWGLNNNALAYDTNTVYAIFTGTGVNLGGGFGSQYCAYHTHGTTTSGSLFYYAAMPYNQQYPSGCTSQKASPNADAAANSELNTLAHEIEETTTDDMGNAWYDSRGYENADKCAWTWGTTATASNGVYNVSYNGSYFLIQQNWVNAGSGGCATGY